jgi:Peptidase family M28
MTVDTFAEAETLVDDIGPRAPGSSGEHAAAGHLAERLRALGRAAEIEPFAVWPRWPLADALNATAGIGASLLSLEEPRIACGLAGLVTLLTVLDSTGLLTTTRRLLGRRESANVVSWGDRARPGALLLVAHYDSGPGGLATSDGFRRRLAAVPVSSHAFLCWTLAAVTGICVLRLAGSSGTALDVVQFALTVALVLTVGLLMGLALSEPLTGENDNASGVALALRLADRAETEHFGVHVLLTGSQKAFAQGMRAFLLHHRGSLDRERTVVLNLDSVGDGTPRWSRREGPLRTIAAHPQLVEICEGVAEDSQDEAFGPVVLRTPSDGYAAGLAGLPALTMTCRDEHDFASGRLTERSLAASEDFCLELIRRLDAEVGTELSADR